MSHQTAQIFEEATTKKGNSDQLILSDQPNHDEFLQIMRSIFNIARLFGVAGPGSYPWKIWGGLILCLLTTIEIFAIWKVIKALAGWAVNTVGHRSVTGRFAGAMFYGTAIISQLLCWRLSYSWVRISEYWASVERILSIKYVPSDPTLRRRLVLITAFLISCAVFEHVASMISTIEFNWPALELLKGYTLRSHGFILLPTDYSVPVAIVLFFTSKIATILWNLQDLYIVLISMGLTSRYYRLNQCVAAVCARYEKEKLWNANLEPIKLYTWRKIREAFVKQAMLVRKVDESLGGLILLSNFCNFYFICLQIFLGISYGTASTAQIELYYLISLAWLCIRASSVVLCAANVNVYSTRALPHLYACGAQNYNIEIERLQNQLNKEYVALSGMGLFSLTRTILLQQSPNNGQESVVTPDVAASKPGIRYHRSFALKHEMAGAVVTYELVLIQFDSSERNSTQA